MFVEEHPYSYLALVNADADNGRIAWVALNSAGFAVANTATDNLPASTALGSGTPSSVNPGLIMADAARTCATVDDFEWFLTHNLGRETMTRSNFLALDARGNASIFETHSRGFKRLNASETPEGGSGNTNFSRSGEPDKGHGYLRFDREAVLLKAAPSGRLSTDYILQMLSRDLGHPLLHNPAQSEWAKFPSETPVWLHTNYTIDRPSTASATVIHGIRPGEDPSHTTMWVALGEPLTSIAVPLWVAAGQPPAELWEGKDAALSLESERLKALLRPLKSTERLEYLDLTRLDNASGTGWLPMTLAAERGDLKQADDLLKKNPSEKKMAELEGGAHAGRAQEGGVADHGNESRPRGGDPRSTDVSGNKALVKRSQIDAYHKCPYPTPLVSRAFAGIGIRRPDRSRRHCIELAEPCRSRRQRPAQGHESQGAMAARHWRRLSCSPTTRSSKAGGRSSPPSPTA